MLYPWATVESVELAKDGLITRGVLVDVPMIRGIDWVERGEGVMPQDIEAAEQGTRQSPGGGLHRLPGGLPAPVPPAGHRDDLL